MTIIDPNFNGLPKPTDWNKVIIPLQQANEKEFRGATLPELGEVMLKDKTVNGQRMKAVPPGPLPAGPADREMYMELLSEGTWTWNGVDVVTNAKGSISNAWWNKVSWSKDDGVVLPIVQGTDELNPTGDGVPKEKATAKYIAPIYSKFVKTGEVVAPSQELSNEVLLAGKAIGNISSSETRAVSGASIHPLKQSLSEVTKLKFTPTHTDIIGGTDVFYDSPSLRGYGLLQEGVEGLGTIAFYLRPTGNNLTEINFIIRSGSGIGDILLKKKITGNFLNKINVKVTVDVLGIDTTKPFFTQFSANGYVALLAKRGTVDLDNAHSIRYTTVALSDVVNTPATTKTDVMYLELGIGKYATELSDIAVEQVKKAIVINDYDIPDNLITSFVPLMRGLQYNAYTDNVFVPMFGDRNDRYGLNIEGPRTGYQMNWGFRTTAGTTNNMDYELTYNFLKGRDIVSTKKQRLVCSEVDKRSGKTVKVNLWADSTGLPSNTYISIVKHIQKLFLNDPLSVEFVGTQGPDGEKTEAQGGYSFTAMTSPGVIKFKVYVNGLTSIPQVEDRYTQGTGVYAVYEINVNGDTGDGYITFERRSGADMAISGVLTRSTGTGDAAIVYTNRELVPANPAYDPVKGNFSFSYYVDNTGISLSDGDLFAFQIGINDIFNIQDLASADAKVDIMMEKLKYIIADVHSYNSNINIGIMITPPPAEQNGFTYSYYLGQTEEMYTKTGLVTWQKRLIAELDNALSRSSGVFLVSGHANIDRKHGYPNSEQRPSSNYTGAKTVNVQTNGVHFNTVGNACVGDMWAGLIKYMA